MLLINLHWKQKPTWTVQRQSDHRGRFWMEPSKGPRAAATRSWKRQGCSPEDNDYFQIHKEIGRRALSIMYPRIVWITENLISELIKYLFLTLHLFLYYVKHLRIVCHIKFLKRWILSYSGSQSLASRRHRCNQIEYNVVRVRVKYEHSAEEEEWKN